MTDPRTHVQLQIEVLRVSIAKSEANMRGALLKANASLTSVGNGNTSAQEEFEQYMDEAALCQLRINTIRQAFEGILKQQQQQAPPQPPQTPTE